MQPEIAVLVSTFQRPYHLLRVLHSLACQRGVEGKFEVVVTDDGSTDDTRQIVEQFALEVDFRVAFTTHPHVTFQLARCRNEGVRASTAPYLVFLDGDCLVPPDHLAVHWSRRRPGVAYAGYCVLFDESTSAALDVDAVRKGEFMSLAPRQELDKLAAMHHKAVWYNILHHPTKPKLFGGNVGIARCDYERINGYDEAYEGWGCEDDDLRLRLRRAGFGIRSILRWTRTYHLWHPPGITTPQAWRDGVNVGKLKDHLRPICCEKGLMNDARIQAA